MIFKGETVDAKREAVFHLATSSSPLDGLAGHVFLVGEVKICLPGGTAYTDVNQALIIERGNGDYALKLTDAQCAVAGVVTLFINVPGAQKQNFELDITDPADIAAAVFASVFEGLPFGTWTTRLIRFFFAKRTGYSTGAVKIRDRADTKDAISITSVTDGWSAIAFND